MSPLSGLPSKTEKKVQHIGVRDKLNGWPIFFFFWLQYYLLLLCQLKHLIKPVFKNYKVNITNIETPSCLNLIKQDSFFFNKGQIILEEYHIECPEEQTSLLLSLDAHTHFLCETQSIRI